MSLLEKQSHVQGSSKQQYRHWSEANVQVWLRNVTSLSLVPLRATHLQIIGHVTRVFWMSVSPILHGVARAPASPYSVSPLRSLLEVTTVPTPCPFSAALGASYAAGCHTARPALSPVLPILKVVSRVPPTPAPSSLSPCFHPRVSDFFLSQGGWAPSSLQSKHSFPFFLKKI